jgi:hypothetical protein
VRDLLRSLSYKLSQLLCPGIHDQAQYGRRLGQALDDARWWLGKSHPEAAALAHMLLDSEISYLGVTPHRDENWTWQPPVHVNDVPGLRAWLDGRPFDVDHSPEAAHGDTVVDVLYRNHRGDVARRRVRPVRWWFGRTEWHPEEPQWLCTAVDVDREEAGRSDHECVRDFALSGVLAWSWDGKSRVLAPDAVMPVYLGVDPSRGS